MNKLKPLLLIGLLLFLLPSLHEFMLCEPGTMGNDFPILVNDNVRRRRIPLAGWARNCRPHLPSEHPSDIVHRQGKPYEVPTHTVTVSGPLKELLGKDELQVNSRHHQAVQWHPEYLFRKDGSSLKLFRRFIEESGRDN